MVGFRVSGRDNLIPDLLGERYIDQRVAVDVPEFSFSKVKFKSAKLMRRLGNTFPFEDGMTDPLLCALNRHIRY